MENITKLLEERSLYCIIVKYMVLNITTSWNNLLYAWILSDHNGNIIVIPSINYQIYRDQRQCRLIIIIGAQYSEKLCCRYRVGNSISIAVLHFNVGYAGVLIETK